MPAAKWAQATVNACCVGSASRIAAALSPPRANLRSERGRPASAIVTCGGRSRETVHPSAAAPQMLSWPADPRSYSPR